MSAPGIGFGALIRSSGVAAPFDPATDNLSLWLRSDDAVNGAGTYPNFRWPGRAAASSSAPSGASSTAKGFVPRPGYADSVFRQSTVQLDSQDTVEWPTAAPYPAVYDEDNLGRVDYFGPYVAHPSAPATFDTSSYTIGLALQPLASNTNGQSGGNVTYANAAIIGGMSEYLSVLLLDDGGTAKFGITHYDAVASALRPSPVFTWPGGFGAWGLLWISYEATTETLIVRVNGTTLYSGTLARTRQASFPGRVIIGCSDGGTNKAKFRLAECMFANQSRPALDLQTRETYFHARYPSLPGL